MPAVFTRIRSEEHTSELQSPCNLVCRLLLEKKKKYFWRVILRIGWIVALAIFAGPLPCVSQVRLFYAAVCHITFPPFFFFFNDTATTEIYTLSLHDALPISSSRRRPVRGRAPRPRSLRTRRRDRKSTRLNSSHLVISYAVFCLKKKKKKLNFVIFIKTKINNI